MPVIAFDTYNQEVTGDVAQTICSRGDSPGGNAHLIPAILETQQELLVNDVAAQLSIFSSEEPPASPSPSRDCERDWLTLGATSPSPSLPLLTSIAPSGFFGRTSPEFCRHQEGEISVPSCQGWQNSGMGGPTGFLTLSTSEHAAFPAPFPSDDGVCSLSDVLETGALPQRLFLTARACAGILRRAAARGKELPAPLEAALRQVADSPPTSRLREA